MVSEAIEGQAAAPRTQCRINALVPDGNSSLQSYFSSPQAERSSSTLDFVEGAAGSADSSTSSRRTPGSLRIQQRHSHQFDTIFGPKFTSKQCASVNTAGPTLNDNFPNLRACTGTKQQHGRLIDGMIASEHEHLASRS